MGKDIPLWQFMAENLEERRRSGLFRVPHQFESVCGRLVRTSSGEELIHFGANDYLGLSFRPELLETGAIDGEASGEQRYGAGASPLLAGHSPSHEMLKRAIAEFEGTEDCVLFSSGFAANLGVVSSLAGEGDILFSDALNHASLIDGCRLSRASVKVYRHNDMSHLKELILEHRANHRHAFVLTDSLFSMDGDLADLRTIELLAEENDLVPIVDEAHATGVYGSFGSGLLSELGCVSKRWIKVGTLSKSLGCSGGFVAADRIVCQWLHNYARSYIYSTSMPVHHCRVALSALSVLRGMEVERRRLRANAVELRRRLRESGLRVGGEDSPIIAVYAPSVEEVLRWSNQLRSRGLYVPAIRPPTVPVGSSMLRISIGNSHLPSDFDLLVDSCRF